MSILWAGGEDIDFPNGNAVVVQTGAGNFRSGWARCIVSVSLSTSYLRSTAFPGGAVTSCWMTFRSGAQTSTSILLGGLIKDTTTNSGLYIGTSSSSASKIALFKFDGTTKTQLAAESGSTGLAAARRFDMQVINYGASATVNVYVESALVIAFTGDVTVSGVTSLGAVAFGQNTGGTGTSEVIVADTDTRSLQGLVTLALTGAGTTNAWTNPTFSNINGTTISDLNPTSSNTNAQDNQYNVTDLPAGIYDVKAVKTSIRAAVSSSPAVTKIKMGYNSGGSTGFGTGATKTPTAAYTTIEQLDATNPVTSAAWALADMNALQLEFQSGT